MRMSLFPISPSGSRPWIKAASAFTVSWLSIHYWCHLQFLVQFSVLKSIRHRTFLDRQWTLIAFNWQGVIHRKAMNSAIWYFMKRKCFRREFTFQPSNVGYTLSLLYLPKTRVTYSSNSWLEYHELCHEKVMVSKNYWNIGYTNRVSISASRCV